jgi:hypothetical protein
VLLLKLDQIAKTALSQKGHPAVLNGALPWGVATFPRCFAERITDREEFTQPGLKGSALGQGPTKSPIV